MSLLDWIQLENYPYLTCSLVLLLVFCVVFLIERKHRTLLLFGALGSTAFSLSSPVFVPEYWNPVRVACFLVGPEDLIFSFANGGMIWFLATWPFRNRLDTSLTGIVFAKNFLLCTLLGTAFTVPGWLAGFGPMSNCLVAMAIMGCVLLFLKPQFWGVAFAGALSFTCIYAATIVFVTVSFPEFSSQWTHENLWGPTLFSLPIEEYAWALGFGAVFPLILAVSANARLLPRCPSTQGATS